jgi:saccharopine dehydrogenase (NAD+, L-lysine forming)
MLKNIGILREEKQPVDKRTPLTPTDCSDLMKKYPGLQVYAQPCRDRCYKDEEFKAAGVKIQENLLDCDLLLGVKEIPIHCLMPSRRYMFFSHTIKRQLHNLKLLQTMLDMNIELIDYEALENDKGERVVAFGYWAGIVGSYNAIWMTQKRLFKKTLPRLFEMDCYEDGKANLKGLDFGQLKFLITGTGRVGSGAVQVMEDAGIKRVSPQDFLNKTFETAVYTQLGSSDMFVPKFKHIEFSRDEFHNKPLNFKSNMEPYTQVADVLINAIYWDPKAPQLFTMKDMKKSSFKIKSIADITCDIAPESSIPSTVKASTIPQPVYGFLPLREKMVDPFTKSAIDVMSIPNLPSELPKDASKHFSTNLSKIVIPEFFKEDSAMLKGARVIKNKQLTDEFLYLESYVYDDIYRASRIKS